MACRFLFQSKRQLNIVTSYLMVFIQKTQKKAMSVLRFPIPVNSCPWSTFTAWIFFQAFFSQLHAQVAFTTAMTFLQIILHSAVHIYDFHIFIISSLSFHGFITNQLQRPTPSWLVSLIGRALPTGNAEVKGSNPVEDWIFLWGLLSQLHKLSIQLRWSSFK